MDGFLCGWAAGAAGVLVSPEVSVRVDSSSQKEDLRERTTSEKERASGAASERNDARDLQHARRRNIECDCVLPTDS